MQPTGRLLPSVVLSVLLGLLAPGIARARQVAPGTEPPTRPLLRIETGMHTGLIRRMDVDSAYSYVPQNFDPLKWQRTVVSYTNIQWTLRNIAGKALFFVDTRHSGNVNGSGAVRKGSGPNINRVVNELSSAENEVIVFTASTGRQYALEDVAWNNGAFTKAEVEGLSGKADFRHIGRITVNMLDLYVSERVKELTGGRQTPTTIKPATISDFPVAAAAVPK